jgi:hypothetical protein
MNSIIFCMFAFIGTTVGTTLTSTSTTVSTTGTTPFTTFPVTSTQTTGK